MNTRYLEEFLAFSELLNWTAAAKQLYTTRPTLVEHMRSLEAELGCPLVASEHGRPALTPAGRRFTRSAEETLEYWERVRGEYRELADNLLVVRVATGALPWIKPALYRARRAIQQRDPEKRVEISSLSKVPDTVESLRAGDLDVVVAGRKSYITDAELPVPDGLRGFRLGTAEIRFLMTRENPLFGQDELRAADLDGATVVLPPLIYAAWVRDGMAARLANRGARVTLRTMDFGDYDEYFAFDFGPMFGIVPTMLEPLYSIDELGEFRTFALADLPVQTTVFVLFRADFAAGGNGRALFEEMRRAVGEGG